MKTVNENLNTPIRYEYDVMVAGGGVAGIAAALASARSGASTILCEREYGLGGLATLGLITPSIIVIVIVARMLQKFKDSKYVEYAFYGLRAASVGLIAAALLGVAKIAFFNADIMAESGNFFMAVDYKSLILSAVIFVLITKFKKLHPIALIVFSAVVGILLKM